MHRDLYCDLETYSDVDIKCGPHAYSESPNAEILIWTYAIDDGDVFVWQPQYEPIPQALLERLNDPETELTWHNGGMFDMVILQNVGHKYNLPHIPYSRVFDTMACALAHALPAKLETLCTVLGVEEDKAKLKTGKKLIQLFCKPAPKSAKRGRATRDTHPVEWAELIEYATFDIHAMRECKRRMPKWNYQGFEYDLWLLDQKINQRGVQLDLVLAQSAVEEAEKLKTILAADVLEATNGEVESATKRDKMLEFILKEYGVMLPDLQKDTLERRLSDPDLPESVKDLIRLRLEASTSSTSKYKTMMKAVSKDGRARGLLQFCGAGRTARWAGRIVQPQNFPRPTMKPKEVEFGIETIKAHATELFYDKPMRVIANATRGAFIAPPGRKLVVADLANIEGRDAAWLAGEEWKLKAFQAYDDGLGPDLYCVAYGKSFNVDPHTVEGDNRQIGKVQELMLQYEGGVGAFVTGAATYRIDLDNMAERALPNIPAHILKEATNFWEWSLKMKMETYGLSEEVFVVCDSLKRLWRLSHPMISSYWPELRQAYMDAVENPGNTFHARMLKFRRDGSWLRIQLPSGRYLCYPAPKISIVTEESDKGKRKTKVCTYMGLNQYTKQWSRQFTYGGKIFENICQAVARDVMAYAMPEVEKKGYDIILTVHDELITEVPDSEDFNVDELSAILSAGTSWTEGLPLAAAGFEAYRYRKG